MAQAPQPGPSAGPVVATTSRPPPGNAAADVIREDLNMINDDDIVPVEVMTMGKPIEERNLVEHAVEYNPHRKSLEVFLMLGVLTSIIGTLSYAGISYTLIESFFKSGAKQHHAASLYDICDDDGCGEYEHRTMGFVNWKSNPCDSYFLYACSGFQKEAVDLNLAVYESHHDFITTEYELLASSFFTGEDYTEVGAAIFSIFKGYYVICRTADSLHFDAIEQMESLVSSVRNEDLTVIFDRFNDRIPDYAVLHVARTAIAASSATCYFSPPEIYFPHAVFDSENFKTDFIQAFIEYYQTAQQTLTEQLRDDVETFFNHMRHLVHLMRDPKQRLFGLREVSPPNTGMDKLFTAATLQCTKAYWLNSEYYEGLKEFLRTTPKVDIVNMLKFRVYLKLSLFGKRPTPLARLYYQYSRFMNDPLASEFRCLDALESWFRPYLFDYLRRSHVHVYRDIPTNLSLHAENELKQLIHVIKRFLARSVLDEKDAAEANSMLDSLNIKLFYPMPLKQRQADPDMHGFLIKAPPPSPAKSEFKTLADLFTTSKSYLEVWSEGWPLHTFAHEPLYVPHKNTLYVPYSVFVWAYVDTSSKLPFNIPVYGFKIVRELFRVFDYRSNSWVTSGTSSAPAYQKLETCVKDRIETKYKLNKSVEQYETIAELAAVHMLYEMYVDTVQRNRGDYADIRLPFLRSVPSTTQFFVALASELCARVNGTTAALLNEEYGRKTAEQRLNIIATFMPQFTEHFKCGHKSRMRTEKTYRDCLFWR